MNRSPNTFRQRLRVGGLAAALALLVALTFGASAFSADSKTYRAVFTSTAPGGENGYSMPFTLENLRKSGDGRGRCICSGWLRDPVRGGLFCSVGAGRVCILASG